MSTKTKIIILIAVALLLILGFAYSRGGNIPSIQISAPKSGDVVETGFTQVIKWTTKNIPANYKIAVSIRRVPPPPLQTEGQEFDPIIFTNLPNTGSAEWKVSDMYPEGNYVIGLTAYESLPVTNPVSAESEVFKIQKNTLIGGTRDEHGCLTAGGYAFDAKVGACIRSFEMTADIMKAAKIAVDYVGQGYALTVVSFNSYEEPGAYDIMLERGAERTQQTVYIKNWKVQSVSAALGCNDSPKYFAIEQSLRDTVGSNILIKYKTSPDNVIPCDYKVSAGDFELKNVLAEYFLAFTDNFLVLDQGTAPPPRKLIVYDLRSRKQVFTDTYTSPVTVAGDSITYFSKTSTKPTSQNCPKLNEYTSGGLGAAIMSKVTVDLATLNKKTLGEYECVATQ